MLEFILDLVFDIILEGSSILLAEAKVPIFLRVIAFIIVAGVFLFVAGLLFLIGYSSLIDKEYVGALILLAGGFFVLIGGLIYVKKEFKKRKGDKYEKNETNINY